MALSARVIGRWIQLASVATALSLMIYMAVHQVGRQTADDPQVQLARDASAELASGIPSESVVGNGQVKLETSLAPWITVVDEKGEIVGSSARLRGELRTVPTGVLDHARSSGEERVTWQPEKGVRMATVIVHDRNGGFVVAGRSLQESEARTLMYGRLMLTGWLLTLVGLLVVVAATEAGLLNRSARA